MPYGLHQVNKSDNLAETLIIGIHGSNSEGYEWVYPLWKLNNDFTEIYFYRWNDGQCANKDNYILINELSKGPPRQSQYSEHQGSCSQLWGALFITFISVNRRIFGNSKQTIKD